MKVIFCSNYLSHHQMPFCDAMFKRIGKDFSFIACDEFDEQRIVCGWHPSAQRPYEIRKMDNTQQQTEAMRLTSEADVMIWGSASLDLVMERKKTGKLTFRYSERLFKEGLAQALVNLDFLRYVRINRLTRMPNQYLLCASSYSKRDFVITRGQFVKCYKWGYFPQTFTYDVSTLFTRRNQVGCVHILWAGRLLPWKHPESCIFLAKYLERHERDFLITIIGNGEMEERLKKEITLNQLENHIKMIGVLQPEEVRLQMEEADIFLFTSDYREGWGAVLNESMNSGCAVVCSSACGAARYLVRDGYNGMLYPPSKNEELAKKVEMLIDNPKMRFAMGERAYKTITDVWSAEVAAERFCTLSGLLLSEGKPLAFRMDDGPLSEA